MRRCPEFTGIISVSASHLLGTFSDVVFFFFVFALFCRRARTTVWSPAKGGSVCRDQADEALYLVFFSCRLNTE